MSVQIDTTTRALAGEYVVATHGYGDGWDYYLTVTGPDGSSTEQKVYWLYGKTAFQVAEEGVLAVVGTDSGLQLSSPTREDHTGRYVVTLG